MRKAFFVSGIGTDVGKTVVCSLLCKAWNADYWKPVQAGTENGSDSQRIFNWGLPAGNVVHPETFLLKEGMSPHAAAEREGVEINLNDFTLPDTSKTLIVEGAGGLMVPLNLKGDLVLDLALHLQLPLILVSRFYLGSINHTLLSLELLKTKGISPVLLVFTGTINPDSLLSILQRFPALQYIHVPDFEKLDSESMDEWQGQHPFPLI